MANGALDTKRQAHEMIDRLSADQVSAVVGLFATMLDPVDRTIANAPFEDEPISDEEERAVAVSKAWLAEHPGEGTSLQELMAEFDLSSETLEKQPGAA